jgi:hypothetical protein
VISRKKPLVPLRVVKLQVTEASCDTYAKTKTQLIGVTLWLVEVVGAAVNGRR